MSQSSKKFYITTAIDYPNSLPHMGHAYEKVVADFYARAYRLLEYDTRFLIGLDEHGQKIQDAADAAGQSPQDFVDEKAQMFTKLYDLLEVSYDDFIRTSEDRHHAFVQGMYERIRDRGDVYKGKYQGDYCVSCEKAYTKSELIDGKCPVHEIATTVVEEESYFFRLGKYRDAIRRHIEDHPSFIFPQERRNEIVSRLREEVTDLSISRSSFAWGIPLPDDADHVLYVWIDALSNYMSALTAPRDHMRYWPADCHVIGKDINWFHTVIWPSMLLSAGYPLPEQVYVHGFILDQAGRKMSKHMGNVVDPLGVIREYSVDVLRFYFLRTFSSGSDGNFSLKELEERYTSELGNDLGNLVLRVAKLIQTRLGGTVRTPGRPANLEAEPTLDAFFRYVHSREHHRAVEALWGYVRRTNAYLNETQPWKLSDASELEPVLASALEALRVIAHLAFPIMPATAQSIAKALGFQLGPISRLDEGAARYSVTLPPPLFPRRETPKKEAPRPGAEEPVPQKTSAPTQGAVDPFAKLDLRVGIIEEVREHPDAESLFALTVAIGGERRSICAGLRRHLSVDDLQGRKVLVLANLKPAQLRGIESRGMVLATDLQDGKVVPVDPGEAASGEPATVEGIESRPKSKLSIRDFEKAPLVMQDGVVIYAGKPLGTSAGPIRCDQAVDGASVR